VDSLTQIVLGAAVGETVLGKKVGNKAMLYGAIAGTIPDLDVIARFFTDAITATEWHRGFSHSIFFSVVFAPIFGFLISKIERKQEATWKGWSWLMFWSLFTHPLLDAHTTWGTQLFWPLNVRLAYKNIFVIDPLYTLPFLIFLILAMLQKRSTTKRKKYNTIGLLISSGYLVLTLILKGVSYYKFVNNLKEQQISYKRIATRPSPFNTILWSAIIEQEDAYLMGEYSFFDTKPIRFTSFPKNHQLLGDLHKEDKIQRIIKITEDWYTIVEKEGQLYFNDLRFGLMSLDANEDKFAFSYKIIKDKKSIILEEQPKYKEDAKKIFPVLWKRIWGN